MTAGRIFKLFISLTLVLSFPGCNSSEGTNPCGESAALTFDNNICLTFEHPTLNLARRGSIEARVTEGLEIISALMPINNVNIRIVKDSTLVIAEIGMGGYNPNANEIEIAIDASFADLDNSLETELIPLLAHEMHHAKRRRSVGYGFTLLEAVVSEGLADHFSIEVSGGAPPPWSVAITGNDLQALINTASNTWNQQGYDHAAWFFGTSPSIPRWAGYSIGYELVRIYLQENPDKLPSRLHSEPASSFE